MNNDIVYDLETYRNFFCGYFGNADTRKAWSFEISDRKDEREEMIEFLRQVKRNGQRMVGFNNLAFDYQVLHFILKKQDCSVRQIYNFANKLINAEDDEKFKIMVPEYKMMIPQLDLYKIHHFDNKSRATSLKMLEFNMRSDNIEDLPFPPDTKLTDEQKDKVLRYNKHDMVQTCDFYNHSLEQIRFREELTKKYGKNFMNANDTKIGKDYFIMRLEENAPGCCYKNRKVQQTKRDKIDLSECVLDYIQFESDELQAVKDWLCEQTITKTKGVFTDILEKDLGKLADYAKLRTKQKKYSSREEAEAELFDKAWVEDRELKSGKTSHYLCWRVADNLNTVLNGFQFDFGTGGIHGSIENEIVDTDDEGVLLDLDVASYYPNLAIVNNIYPEHLGGTFCNIYSDVFKQRKSYDKGTPENAMMKLALNGVYGSSNDMYSPFYDPKFTMTITVSGQLTLCMLAEKLMEVSSLRLIQLNTDGLTVKVSSDEKQTVDDICKEWMDKTGLELEESVYKRMAIRDVNSYLALDIEDKVKQKGAYQYKDMGWHTNQSALVIPMAAEHALLYDGDYEEFIYNHKNIYDFMLRTKVPRNSRLVGVDEDGEHPLQNITRYYVANDGVSLVKCMPPLKEGGDERRIGVESKWKVKTCNNIKDYDRDIDYEYYVKETEKLLLTRQ